MFVYRSQNTNWRIMHSTNTWYFVPVPALAFCTASLRPLITVILGPFTAAMATSLVATLEAAMAFFTSYGGSRTLRKGGGRAGWS